MKVLLAEWLAWFYTTDESIQNNVHLNYSFAEANSLFSEIRC